MLSKTSLLCPIRPRGRVDVPRLPVARRLRSALAAIAAAALVLALSAPIAAQQTVRGEASVTTAGGYGRLAIRLASEIESRVRLSGSVLVIEFKQPVDVPVDRMTMGANGYISAARRDPDGRALRFALARKVKISSMVAAERLFVDLLPESWSGEPPGLPREVVEELARRAKEAERLAREKARLEQEAKIPPVTVRVASEPTFTRYVFELPELTGVSTERSKDTLTLSFSAPLKFDLAEAKLALPVQVTSIDATHKQDTAVVRFAFARPVDVRTFREDSNYVVDLTPVDAKSAPTMARTLLAGTTVPNTVAAEAAGKAAPQPAAAVTAPAPLPAAGPHAKIDALPPPAGNAPVTTPEKPAAAAAKNSAPSATQEAPRSLRDRGADARVTVEVRRKGDNLQLLFPFATPTPAAVFQRADSLWLVFDATADVDIGALTNDQSRTIRSADVLREAGAQLVRLKLERPRLTSVALDESGWAVTIGEAANGSTRPLSIVRNIIAPGRNSITIPFDDPQKVHRLTDVEAGDTLLVVTGLGPARGLVKSQDFVEFRALASAHGIVVQPIADDMRVELAVDKVLFNRPGGLILSGTAPAERQQAPRAVTFDSRLWSADREADFADRQFGLIRTAAAAPFTKRAERRLDLARFYFSREMFAEAKAVLDAAIADDRFAAGDASPLVLRAVANIMLGRNEEALRDLANPLVGNQNDAQLWRAVAYARQGKWAQARDAFRFVEGALAALPLELQRIALMDAFRASLEVGDFSNAAMRLNDFQTIGVPRDIEPPLAVLTGRLAERLGRNQDALAAYRVAAASDHRPAAAQGRLREIALRYSLGEINKTDAVNELEVLTIAWRGDETELEALQILARLYTEESRYRDAFQTMRVALTAHPASDLTRHIHDEAAKTFDLLFLAGRGDTLPAIDALSLFYDFRDLTPIGRRGDEMIRRLADRLVSVDLLDQAAELLQYQVDNRLQGAARAQVATRLAVVYLMNRKPDKAQATLRATRTADLSKEIRIPRLLLEARALSDLGRHDFALEVIESIEGREAVRLRSDIYWAARRWQKAAEQIELLYGDRWTSFEPLTDTERSDILRAGVAYALAEDKMGIARLREKYVAKMATGPDRRAFDLVTGGLGINSAEFREVARSVASVDTLTVLLRDLRARYPEMRTFSPAAAEKPASAPTPPAADPGPTGSLPQSPTVRLTAR
jgi:tetratricopeptide (TPR) repeat protein